MAESELQKSLNNILADKEANLLPENLKKGVTLLGIEGTLDGGIDTLDATASTNDIISPKTAYVNGKKVEGKIVPTYKDTGDNKKEYTLTNPDSYTITSGNKYILYINSGGLNIIDRDIEGTSFISCSDLGFPSDTYQYLAVSAPDDNNYRYVAVSKENAQSTIYYAQVDFNTFKVISTNSLTLGLAGGGYSWQGLGNTNTNPKLLYAYGLTGSNSRSFVSVINCEKGTVVNRINGNWMSSILFGLDDKYVLVNNTQDMFWIDDDGNVYDDTGTTFKSYLLCAESKLACNLSDGNIYKYTEDTENRKLTLTDTVLNIGTDWGLPTGGSKIESALLKNNIIYLNQTKKYYKDGKDLGIPSLGYNGYNVICNKNICKGDIELSYLDTSTNKLVIYTTYNIQEITQLLRDGIKYIDTSDASSITAEDVVKDKVVYGSNGKVTGTATLGVDTSDATATSKHLIKGKTAYVNGEKIEGEIYDPMNLIIGANNTNGASLYYGVNPTSKNITFRYEIPESGQDTVLRKSQQLDGQYISPGIDISIPTSQVASQMGVTANKILAGNILMGVTGTAKTPANSGVVIASSLEELKTNTTQITNTIGIIPKIVTSRITETPSTNTTSSYENEITVPALIVPKVITLTNAMTSSWTECTIRYGYTDQTYDSIDYVYEDGEYKIVLRNYYWGTSGETYEDIETWKSTDGVTFTNTNNKDLIISATDTNIRLYTYVPAKSDFDTLVKDTLFKFSYDTPELYLWNGTEWSQINN